MTDPIVKEITVPLPPDRAFRLFTEEMGAWWPLETHSRSAQEGGAPAKHVEVPKEIGQEVLETRPDGSRVPWGRVTEHRPGRAFGMSWHPGRPASEASHVRVTFDVVADGTRVRLVHDNWAALGETALLLRERSHSGWDMALRGRFAAAAARYLVCA